MNALGMALGHVIYGAAVLIGWVRDVRYADRLNVPGEDDL